jgi:hypothetical protein
MKDVLTLQGVGFFILFVVPGLISMTVYRLLMPARAAQWADAVVQSLFYSSLNFALLSPLIYWLYAGEIPARHPLLLAAGALLVLAIFPVLWPIGLLKLYRWKWLARKIHVPHPTVWDYFFDKREPVFVLVRLNNGSLIGGFWGVNSYAGSFPNDGDIYLEAVYRVDANGKFGNPHSGHPRCVAPEGSVFLS